MALWKPGRKIWHDGDRLYLFENFKKMPQKNASVAISYNLDWEILHSAGGISDTDCILNVEGGVTLGTQDSTANDDCILNGHLAAAQSMFDDLSFGSDHEPIFECLIDVNTAITDIIIWAGLKKTQVQDISADTDALFMHTDNDNSYVGATVETANTAYTTVGQADTPNQTLVQAHPIHVRCEVDRNMTGRVYINGRLEAQAGGLAVAALKPYVGCEDDTGGAVNPELNVRWIAVSRRLSI